MIAIMAAHRIPYIATATVAHVDDLIGKFERARDIRGTRFLLLYSPCPSGWKSRPEDTIELSRLAVRSRIFPVLEIENGTKWTVTVEPGKTVPVLDYLKLQGRFRHLTEDQVALIQESVDREWRGILNKVQTSKEPT
jgi:pyruvate/2-oxoacid:ferredoxin oxidoreductase beta subunit